MDVRHQPKRAFGLAEIHTLRLTAPLVAAEFTLNSKLFSTLEKLGGMREETADRLAKDISKSELIDLLACFYEISDRLIARIKESFNMRNNILHGGQRKQASEAAVRRAIEAAAELQKARLKAWVERAKS